MLETRPTDLSFRVLLRESIRRRDEALDEIRERVAGLIAIGLVVAIPLLGILSGPEFSLVEKTEAAEPIRSDTFEPPAFNVDAVANSIETNEPSPSEVRAIQILLKDKGFDPGPIDGVAGKRTLSALNAYRQSVRLSPVLAISRESLSALASD